jgi:trehalose/maltose hydrolase-like predicted phosphorylase
MGVGDFLHRVAALESARRVSSTEKKPTVSRSATQPIARFTRLFVDDQSFSLRDTNLLSYDRRLNMKSGTES